MRTATALSLLVRPPALHSASHAPCNALAPLQVWLAFNNTDDGSPPSAIVDARDLAAALRANGTFTS